jgi:adenylosuccinate lyase
MHERLREHSLGAWAVIAEGKPNPLSAALPDDPELQRFLSSAEIARLMDAAGYVGDAPLRARALAQSCRDRLNGGPVLP